MTLVRHSFERKPHAPSPAPDTATCDAMRQAQQCLLGVAHSRGAYKQQVEAARAAIVRSRALLASDMGQGYAAAASPQQRDARAQVPCPSQSQRDTAMAEPGDLGKAIATAILRLVPDLIDQHGLIFEIADPEPVLRGVASAYAAIARALPGGQDEAWTLWALLASELEQGDRQSAAS